MRRARVRAVQFQSNQGPIATMLFAAIGVLVGLLALAIVIPLVLLAGAVGLVAALAITAKRRLALLGKPNGHVGPVRTDGRSNVRVITRD